MLDLQLISIPRLLAQRRLPKDDCQKTMTQGRFPEHMPKMISKRGLPEDDWRPLPEEEEDDDDSWLLADDSGSER